MDDCHLSNITKLENKNKNNFLYAENLQIVLNIFIDDCHLSNITKLIKIIFIIIIIIIILLLLLF